MGYLVIILLIILFVWWFLSQKRTTRNNRIPPNATKKLPPASHEYLNSTSVINSRISHPINKIQDSSSPVKDTATPDKSLLEKYAESVQKPQDCSGGSLPNMLRLSANDFLRRYKAGERCFSKVDLTGENLEGIYIIGVDLKGAILRKTNLSHGAILSSDLTGADLSEANLSYASLVCSNLSRANLSHTKLIETDLSSADLSFSILGGVDMSSAIFYETKMEGIESS